MRPTLVRGKSGGQSTPPEDRRYSAGHGILLHPRAWPRRCGIIVLSLLLGLPELWEWFDRWLVQYRGSHLPFFIPFAILFLLGWYDTSSRLARVGKRTTGRMTLALAVVSLCLYLLRGLFWHHGLLYYSVRVGLVAGFLALLMDGFWARTPAPELEYPARLSRRQVLTNLLIGVVIVGLLWVIHVTSPHWANIVVIPAIQ